MGRTLATVFVICLPQAGKLSVCYRRLLPLNRMAPTGNDLCMEQITLCGTAIQNGTLYFTIRYVRSKAGTSQLNLPHGTDN